MQVAVITRTQNRMQALRRTFETILGQAHQKIVWVIVNDGGEPQPVEHLAAEARREGLTVLTVHGAEPRGRGTAANLGLQQAGEAPYVAFLDDDGTWDESFLAESVAYLERERWCEGVACQTAVIAEDTDPDGIKELSLRHLNPTLKEIFMIDMLGRAPFTGHAFVFRRRALDSIGPLTEALPQGADDEFHCRFIEQFDIGVIPRPLVFWHQPINPPPNGRHAAAEVRDRLIRRDLDSGKMGIGTLGSLSAAVFSNGERLGAVGYHLSRLPRQRSPSTRI